MVPLAQAGDVLEWYTGALHPQPSAFTVTHSQGLAGAQILQLSEV